MTGIAGVIYPNVFYSQSFMDPLLNSLSHRGVAPSEELIRDAYTYKNVTFGITGGRVFANPTQTIAAILDGHIYNYYEILRELTSLGYELSTDQPAELLVYAYDAWGENFAEKLDGDFTAALFDRNDETLYLFRDRTGVKPLYWYYEQNMFLFASELKSLLATKFVPQTPAKDSIAIYLALGYIPQDMTPIENVNKLLPANVLKFSLEKGLSIHSYWSFSDKFLDVQKDSAKNLQDELDALLRRSVQKRIVPERRVGCFVSGGLGSASIASYVRAEKPYEELPAFTVGFKGQNEADIVAATGFANQLHLNQNVGMITPKTLLDDFVKVIWYCDEPLSDPTVVATWNLARLAAWQVQYVYSGMGSDELVAGHGRYTTAEQESALQYSLEKMKQLVLRHLLIPLYKQFNKEKGLSLLKHTKSNLWLVSYIRNNCIFSENLIKKAAPSLANLFTPDFFIHKFHKLTEIQPGVCSYLYLDFKTRLPDLYIAQYERLTTANGLDWRAPYLDRDVIEFLARFPEPEILQEKETAAILKAMFADVFPKDLLNRPKKTRKKLLSTWVTDSDLFPLFQQLRTGALVESGIIDENWVATVTSSPQKCEENFKILWCLLVLEVWFRLFINLPVTGECPELTLNELLALS